MHDARRGMRGFPRPAPVSRRHRGRTARRMPPDRRCAPALRCATECRRSRDRVVPAPAAMVSAAWLRQLSPSGHRRGDAALRPDARAGRPGARARQDERREGRELQRREQAGKACAQDQRALGFDDVVDCGVMATYAATRCCGICTASMRSTALLPARRSRDRPSLRCVIVSQRMQDAFAA